MQEPFALLAERRVEIVDRHIAVLTMNSPPVNALTRRLDDKRVWALARIPELDELRVVVPTGAGKVFFAGAGLKGRAGVIREPGDLRAHSRRTRACFHAIRECAQPVVAAINGAALGSGLAMVASSDVPTGWRVPADGLYRTGVVEACTTHDALMPTALDMAGTIAAGVQRPLRPVAFVVPGRPGPTGSPASGSRPAGSSGRPLPVPPR